MQHRHVVHTICRILEHHGQQTREDDPGMAWWSPLLDAALAAESEMVPLVDDAEQASALVSVALALIDLSTTGPGIDKPHRKAWEAVRRYLERIEDVVADRERAEARRGPLFAAGLAPRIADAERRMTNALGRMEREGSSYDLWATGWRVEPMEGP